MIDALRRLGLIPPACRQQAQQSQRTAAEAQLRLLQSQLEPHMLFNTLANLRVLIGSDPARAGDAGPVDHLPARHAGRVASRVASLVRRVRSGERLSGIDGRAHGGAIAGGARRDLLPRRDTSRFWQIHRGTVVRAHAIASAERDESGKIRLTLHERPERLVVSRLYAHLFRAM